MSRVGKLPIKLPAGVEININDNHVTVKGKLGSLEYDLLPGISVETADGYLKVKRAAETKQMKANHGLSRALLQNMVTGVSEGYEKILHVIGTGYSAERIGPWLKLTLGYSHDTMVLVPNGLTVEAEAVPRSKGTKADLQSIIRIKGKDKQLVGQFAAEVRAVRPPENYKGKGVRYHDEHVIIKAGKAGTK
ncbi:MAG TPA: 50S ribosomal protein L6 [Candidatus Cloacimonadota bacterium]|nr:50S ribosomal protein L6 [Candidatus Cloacimonadota bacterium]HOV17275.1 50S ribosomal protein L6 [Candidatus Cloacimonadota bacterium]HQL14655.1 50S ribosomal protein L6 [Candidatus Cloacimonadota bacterium]